MSPVVGRSPGPMHYDREALVEVLVYHQATKTMACHCGWHRAAPVTGEDATAAVWDAAHPDGVWFDEDAREWVGEGTGAYVAEGYDCVFMDDTDWSPENVRRVARTLLALADAAERGGAAPPPLTGNPSSASGRSAQDQKEHNDA